MHRSAIAAALCLLLAGCVAPSGAPPASSSIGTPTGASAAPQVTPTLTPAPLTPAPPAAPTPLRVPPPALGAWTPTCADAAADATALVANLTAQPAFAGARPSGVPGFADAAASAVRPLYDCPVAHSLRVKDALRVGSDADATAVVRTKLSALLRTVQLTLSGTKVGRFPFGSVGLAEARPVLVAVLGEPDETHSYSCLEYWSETSLRWGTFLVSFDDFEAGQPIVEWQLAVEGDHPLNLELSGGMPFRATLQELRRLNPDVDQYDVFGVGGPWAAEAEPGLFYLWQDAPATSRSSSLIGGTWRTCE